MNQTATVSHHVHCHSSRGVKVATQVGPRLSDHHMTLPSFDPHREPVCPQNGAQLCSYPKPFFLVGRDKGQPVSVSRMDVKV
ncbi:hypothetical protein BTVI_89665 [Pitangus sulphuratus]|nr:hypothetical protein BTVI_89665 [Pitangus sulphuratus]